jgi:hypothetical protein
MPSKLSRSVLCLIALPLSVSSVLRPPRNPPLARVPAQLPSAKFKVSVCHLIDYKGQNGFVRSNLRTTSNAQRCTTLPSAAAPRAWTSSYRRSSACIGGQYGFHAESHLRANLELIPVNCGKRNELHLQIRELVSLGRFFPPAEVSLPPISRPSARHRMPPSGQSVATLFQS